MYKQYEGDLNASEITMPDEERIELMLLVKEGKLSMHEAVEKVSYFFILLFNTDIFRVIPGLTDICFFFVLLSLNQNFITEVLF